MLSSKFLAPTLLALALPLVPMMAQAQDNTPKIGISVAPSTLREDGPAPVAKLRRIAGSTPRVVLKLVSTDARVIVPATIVFPEGATEVGFPVRLVNDSIINDPASKDGFHAFRIHVSGEGVAPNFIDLRILDDEPFRPPVTSKVTLTRFEVVDGSTNMVRLTFSGPVSFARNRFGTPIYLLAINGLHTEVSVQAISAQVLVLKSARAFQAGGTLSVAVYNLADASGLPFPDLVRLAVVPAGPRYSLEVSRPRIRENAGANASRVTIRLAYAVAKPLTFTLTVNELLPSFPVKISAPASVTVPAGAREVSFPVAAIDNDRVDGDVLNFIAVASPYPNPPTSPLVRFDIIDDEPAPASTVRIVRAARLAGNVLRLKLSGSIRDPYNIGPSPEKFLIRVGARLFHPRGSISVDASGTVVDVYTGVDLPSTEEVTLTISGLRDASLALISTTSITLPVVPSQPSA